ncbi:death domain-containing protein 1 [Varanus komodoensis]|uniref:death domain-containing protein 1 n=1 Tax=Varanus komodoensis TaxID=61221 RepID=UPI001CF7D605|nr:death domain-containing protein 1 [Varanus komodoensis]
MEVTEAVTEDPNQILEQIWHLNLTLGETLKSECQENESLEYVPELIALLLDLVKALSQQLEHTAKILHNTYKLLNTLHGQDWQQGKSPTEGFLADWLLKLSKHTVHAVGQFGDSQNELLELSSRKVDRGQQILCASETCECDAGRKEVHDVQVAPCTSQPSCEPFPMHEEEQKNQLRGNNVLEMETILSFPEKLPGKEEEFPVLMTNENQSIPEKSIAMQSQNNGMGSHSVTPSAKKLSENIDLGDIPGNHGKKAILSREVENSSENQLQMHPNEEKQAENGNSRLGVKPRRRCKGVNQKEKSNESAESNSESSTRSEELVKNNPTNLSTSKPEEEDNGSVVMSKEFLMEVSSQSEPEVACAITAPCNILENLAITVVNYLSSLVVDNAEELVSNVICVEHINQPTVSPITLTIPFTSRYRGMYKDIMVKMTDTNFKSSYLTPVSLEGYQGNHKGTFAEVKTCQLGFFCVVSCLKKETLTIPRKGLSRKLSMDCRISFCYPPSTFNSRVTMHLKVQPIEPSTISLLKTKHETYYSVVSTSPLVYLQYCSSQPFNKSITVILPCPPNQEKKRESEETDRERTTSASIHRVSAVHHFRAMSASPRKHGENLSESLKLLGYRNKEEGWVLLDDITVRNARNGLVSFELDEHLDSFIIIRLSSPMDNTHLLQFIQNLEQAIYNTMVKVVLYQQKENPYKIVVLLVPSKELNLELQSLREEGYFGPPEPSQQFSMREGEQVHFRFSGNIFASDDGIAFGKTYKLTFHAQRKPRLALQIKEVDEFGNYSSPHYKGTALFYKVSKDNIAKNSEHPHELDDYQPQALLCKLSLTLPKKEKLISRPQSTKRTSSNASEAMWDNVLYWLAQELSEDNASCLALSLPLHRSTLQLIKLKCPDNLTEQIYELLCFWRRNLPRSADKLQLLSRYLCKSGRSDLVEDLYFKWKNKAFGRKIYG